MELSEIHDLTLQIPRNWHARLGQGQTSPAEFNQSLNTGDITDEVAFHAFKLGMWSPLEAVIPESASAAGRLLPGDDAATVRSVIWQLVGLGVLTPRTIRDERSQFFELSAYGKQVLQGTGETPYDPLGFIRRLKADAPGLEQETVDFVSEALACFLGRHLRAAAVMVGLASENEILKLIDLYRDRLDERGKSSYDQGIRSKRNLKDKFDYLYARLYQDRDTIPTEVRELDTWLVSIFHIIRLHRNESGHPTGHNPSREIVHANLTLFLTYARHLSVLKQYWKGESACSSTSFS